MRSKTSLWKRSLAALLSFVMVLGMFPVLGGGNIALEAEAAPAEGTNYITLPITIRDFAADGMLFEYNEVDRNTLVEDSSLGYIYRDQNGTAVDGFGSPSAISTTERLNWNDAVWTATYNPTAATVTNAGNLGLYVLSKDYTLISNFTQWWYCVIIDANGNVLHRLEAGTATQANYEAAMSATYNGVSPEYSVWAWRDSKNLPYYNVLAKITDENMHLYQIGFYNSYAGTSAADLADGDTLSFYAGIPVRRNVNPANYDSEGIYVLDGYYNESTATGGITGITLENLGHEWWHVIVVNTNSGNQVVDVVPVQENKKTALEPYYNATYPEYYRYVFIYCSETNQKYRDPFLSITDTTKGEYTLVLPTCTVGSPLFIERSYNLAEATLRGFGLLFTLDSDEFHNLYDDGDDTWESGEFTIAGSMLEDNDPTNVKDTNRNETPSKTVYIWSDEANLANEERVSQELVYGTIRTGLVEKKLDENTNRPVYTQATVDYLADYMSKVMPYTEVSNSGNYQSFHVMGVKMFNDQGVYKGPGHKDATKDLAQILRDKVWAANNGYKLGTYGESKAKYEAGNLNTYENVQTWYDAAYFLLHNTWSDSALDTEEAGSDGYGMRVPEYHSLHLVETTNAKGQTCYVFNAKYSGTTYENGEIQNSPFGEYNSSNRPYSPAYNKSDNSVGTISPTSTIQLPYLRFDPLGPASKEGWQGYGLAGVMNTYGDLNGTSVSQNWSEYYDETNYHLSLEGHAQFVYQYDANQYFTFTGDDDVYLYINGFRVLDIGGAHAISEVTININDVAKKIGLQNGGTYTFDFFYMERHGTAANFGIETNITIADASMNTVKTGYQNGVNTGYGGPVNANNHVGYSFELQNNGASDIYNLTFEDKDIGVYVGYDKIELNSQLKADGTPLYTFANDIYLIYWDADGTMHYYAPGSEDLTEKFVMDRLKQGLKPKERLGVYGFKYKVQPNQWVDTDKDGTTDTFVNTVYTTATNMEEITPATKTLHGVSDWKVVKMQHPYLAFHVYDWVHKAVSNDPADAENLTWKAPGDNGIPAANSVTVSKDDLINKYLLNGENNLTLTEEQKAAIDIVLCTAAGNKDPYFQNPNVSLDTASGGITYTSKTVGKDTVFFVFDGVPKMDDSGEENKVYESLVFSYEVYTYGAVDNVYVLDYGLAVELAGNNFGFHTNDHLQLNENSRDMTAVVTGMVGADGKAITTKDGTYGDFTWNAETKSLKYTPDKIINNTDEVYAKFRLVETNEDGTEKDYSIYTGVEMVQKITTAPANVVYYEDTFPGITFVDGAFGNWVQYETMKPVYDADGKIIRYDPIAGLEQSPDQDMNYGSNFTDDNGTPDDPSDDIVYAYDKDKEGVLVSKDAEDNYQVGTDEDNLSATLEWGSHDELAENELKELNDYLAIRGGDSNGTVKELVINTTKQTEAMYFTFVGTGVEIIGRTTDDAFAVINVVVQKKDGDNWVNYRMKPVITESIGGDQYQVPIISFTGLPKAEYRVSLKVAKSESTTVERMLYIDGVRIYGPLGDDEALEYYNPEEYKAEFIEVKQLIDDEKAIFCAASSGIENEVFKLVTGGTMVEQVNGETVLKKIESHDEYLRVGPNNELYLLGGSQDFNVVCFFIKEIPNYIDGARTLQIGAHRKADSDTLEYTGSVNMIYGSLNEDMKDAKAGDANFYSVDTGTEMYYDIDIKQLDKDENLGGYIVMIGTNGATRATSKDALALTNIKVAGYTISTVSQAIEDAKNQEQTVSTMSIFTEPIALMGAWLEAANKEPVIEELPVNENMSIEYAELVDDKVSSGNYAMATVKTNSYAQSIVVYDAEGNEVELVDTVRRRKNGAIYFDIAWEITGNRDEVQTYTIRVLDSEKNASVNTKTVTVTIV